MKTLPGLEWNRELTKEHFKIFCNRQGVEGTDLTIRKGTIVGLISNYQLLDYKIGSKEAFKQLFETETIDKIPEAIWEQIRFINDKFNSGLKVMLTGKKLNELIEEYAVSEKGIAEMGKEIEGYRLRIIFDKEKVVEEVLGRLKPLVITLKDDVEHISRVRHIGDKLIDNVADEFYKELNGIER